MESIWDSISITIKLYQKEFIQFHNRVLNKARRISNLGSKTSMPYKSPLKKISGKTNKELEAENARLVKELNEQKLATNELTEKIIIMQSNMNSVEEIKSNTEDYRREFSPMIEFSKEIIKKDVYNIQTPGKEYSKNDYKDDSVKSVHTCPAMTENIRAKSKDQMESKVADHIKMLAIQCFGKIPIK